MNKPEVMRADLASDGCHGGAFDQVLGFVVLRNGVCSPRSSKGGLRTELARGPPVTRIALHIRST